MTSISRRRRLARWIHLSPLSPNVSRNSTRIDVHKSLRNMFQKAPTQHYSKLNKLPILKTTTTSLAACNFITVVCIATILILLTSSTLTIQAAPNPLSLAAKIASVASPNSHSGQKSNSPPHLVKSARLATYSLSCPPEASIHPCTCVYHTPDTQIESEEEEVYEISPAITTPYAESLIRTSTPAPQVPPSPKDDSKKPLESPINLAPIAPSTTTTTTTIPPTTQNAQTSTIEPTSSTTTQRSSTQPTTPPPPPTTETAGSTSTTISAPTSTTDSVTLTTITTTPTPSTSSTLSNTAPVTNSMSTALGVETETISPPAISATAVNVPVLPASTQTSPATTPATTPTTQASADLTPTSTDAPVSSTTTTPTSTITFSSSIAPDNAQSSIVNDTRQLFEAAPRVESNLVELVSIGMTAASSITTVPTTTGPAIETTTIETTSVKLSGFTTTTPTPTTTTTTATTIPSTTTYTASTQVALVDMAPGTTTEPPQPPPPNAIASNGPESRIGTSEKNDLNNLQGFAKLIKDGDDDEVNSDSTMMGMFSKENTLEANPMSSASFAEPLVMTSAASPPPLASYTVARDAPDRPIDMTAATPTSVTPTVETTAASKSTTPAPEQALTSAAAAAAVVASTTTAGSVFKLEASTPAPTSSFAPTSQFAPSSESTSSSTEAPPSPTPTTKAAAAASTSTTTAEEARTPVSTIAPTSQSTTSLPTSTTVTTAPPSSTPTPSTTTTTPTTTTTASTPVTKPASPEPSSKTTTTTTTTPAPTTTPTATPWSTSTTLLTTAEPAASSASPTAASPTSAPSTTTTTVASNRDAAGARAAAAAVTPAPSMKPAMSTTVGDNGSSTNGQRRPHHHQSAVSQASGTQTNGAQQQQQPSTNSSRGQNERPISAGRAIQSRPLTTNVTTPTGPNGTARLANAINNNHSHNYSHSHSHNHNHGQNQQSASLPSQSQNGRQILTPNTHRTRPSSANSSNQAGVARNHSSAHHATGGVVAAATATTSGPSSAAASEPLARSTRAAIHLHSNHNQSSVNSNTHRPLYANSLARQKQQQQQQQQQRRRTTLRPDEAHDSANVSQRLPGGRRLTRFLAPHQHDGADSGEPKVEVFAVCRNIQNPQVLHSAIKGFRGHQVNYFVIDSCKVPPFPNDLFHGIDVRWLEMLNSTVQFHNNFLHGHHHQQQQQQQQSGRSTNAAY